MKNALLFYYDIDISNDKINMIDNNYYFTFQNSNFIVSKYERSLEEAKELYNLSEEMISNNIPIYKIILTQTGNILFDFENNHYLLMIIPKVKNRIITYNDIINFNYVPIAKKYRLLDKSSWNTFWSNKIDYIEYQFNQIEKKYCIIKKSINFYIGIWENAISYFNTNIVNDSEQKCVCHKRLNSKTDILSFLNPLNLVIDYKERDISEYIKYYVMTERYTKENIYSFLKVIPTKKSNIIKFISRTLFPSYYFDIYEEIILDIIDENKIIDVIKNKKNYLFLLKIVFSYFEKDSIPQIDWINNIEF